MAKIKDAAAIAAKWARVTPGRTSEYTEGIRNPRTPWASAAAAGSDNWKQGVTQAAAQDRFKKGVAAAGDGAWQAGALAKGPARFSEGVSIAEPAFAAGFAPYQQVISSLQLPPRMPRGDPRNLLRVAAVADALRKRKVAG